MQLAELDTVEPHTPDEEVDAEVLRTALAAELLDLDVTREAEWNPMLHNPGAALHALLSRPFAPLTERLTAVLQRLRAVPEYLAGARGRLTEMSRCHLETALTQLDGAITLLDTQLPAAARAGRVPTGDLAAAAETARAAIVAHQSWLADRADDATRAARIGERLFRDKLALTLDTDATPGALLAAAQIDLRATTAQLVAVAGQLAGVPNADADTVREVLARLGADTADDTTILRLCRDSLTAATRFTRSRDLVTVFDDPIDVVEMPEVERGVAAACCRESGPLEEAVLPTEFAVSPPPRDWDAERVASFYREYNRHMLHSLTVHEAMPGHALQLMHANRHRATTQARAVFGSGTFIEGWAVYAEELMATHGYRADESQRAASALHIQQLKMKLRSIINTILDIRFHCDDLTENEAMQLMTAAGFQEVGEAAGKWRRVQLTSTQLCTYFVGAREVRRIAADLRTAQPGWSDRQVHDAMLGHGSPAPRHLRTLLGLSSG